MATRWYLIPPAVVLKVWEFSSSCVHPKSTHGNCTRYFGKWKFGVLGEFLPMGIDNQKSILMFNNTLRRTSKPVVSKLRFLW